MSIYTLDRVRHVSHMEYELNLLEHVPLAVRSFAT